ncbi:MAG TPA: hypothetical protein VN817_00760, partial [Solirubrobacteraceae bacterium]|nr:hypothetical protein [Solirubrobacteraceae bacterium]
DEDEKRPAAAVLPSLVYLLEISDLLDTALGGSVSLRLGRETTEASITLARGRERLGGPG